MIYRMIASPRQPMRVSVEPWRCGAIPAAAVNRRTICGKSSESLPMVLKTKSCSLLTTPSRSSPSAAMLGGVGLQKVRCPECLFGGRDGDGRFPEAEPVKSLRKDSCSCKPGPCASLSLPLPSRFTCNTRARTHEVADGAVYDGSDCRWACTSDALPTLERRDHRVLR